MELYIFTKTIDKTPFKTTIINEYKPITFNNIDWRWEESVGSWDGQEHKFFGWIPYVNNTKQSVYQYIMGKTEMIFSDITADDCSKRLNPKYHQYFGLESKKSNAYIY